MTVPSGRTSISKKYIHSATNCNTNHVHFFYDPSVFFKWSDKRTWPDQLLDIRILSIRLALDYSARMFLGVLDGWTA